MEASFSYSLAEEEGGKCCSCELASFNPAKTMKLNFWPAIAPSSRERLRPPLAASRTTSLRPPTRTLTIPAQILGPKSTLKAGTTTHKWVSSCCCSCSCFVMNEKQPQSQAPARTSYFVRSATKCSPKLNFSPSSMLQSLADLKE